MSEQIEGTNIMSFTPPTPHCMINFNDGLLSFCCSMKESIIQALLQIVSMTESGIYVLDKDNTIKLGRTSVIGVGIVNQHICLLFDKASKATKKTEYVVIKDNQDNQSYVEFDSSIYNWVAFINKIQEEARLLDDKR